ncbi:hypothetical protein KFE98_08120 [bacterium SCSIO 12741]|nr:hypothetical protein KFE98_08120 [bacterium SCSIO 12741]
MNPSTTAPNSSTDCKITNDSNKNLTVNLVIDENPNGNVAAHLYEQGMDTLNSQKNQRILSVDEVAIYPLRHQQNPAPKMFHLLICTSDWFFPIWNERILPNSAPIVVSNQDEQTMKAAETFYRKIQAQPNSKQVKQYLAATQKGMILARQAANGKKGSAKQSFEAMANVVNAFFESTTAYQQVTLEKIMAIDSYYHNYPFGYTNYGDCTFYLYSGDGKKSQFVGKLVIENKEGIDLSMPNGGLSCIFYPSLNPSKPEMTEVDTKCPQKVVFSDGVFNLQHPESTKSWSLKPHCIFKKVISQKSSDTEIIPSLIGQIGGVQVVGAHGAHPPTAREVAADKKSIASSSAKPQTPSYWHTLFHPKTTQQTIQSISTITGLYMSAHLILGLVMTIAGWIKSLVSWGYQKLTQKRLDEEKDMVQNEAEKRDAEIREDTGIEEKGPQQPEESDDDLSFDDSDDVQTVKSQIRKEEGELNNLMENDPDPSGNEEAQMDKVAIDLKKDQNLIENSDSANSSPVIQKVEKQVTESGENIEQMDQSIGATTATSAAQDEANSINQIGQFQKDNQASKDTQPQEEDEADDLMMD